MQLSGSSSDLGRDRTLLSRTARSVGPLVMQTKNDGRYSASDKRSVGQKTSDAFLSRGILPSTVNKRRCPEILSTSTVLNRMQCAALHQTLHGHSMTKTALQTTLILRCRSALGTRILMQFRTPQEDILLYTLLRYVMEYFIRHQTHYCIALVVLYCIHGIMHCTLDTVWHSIHYRTGYS